MAYMYSVGKGVTKLKSKFRIMTTKAGVGLATAVSIAGIIIAPTFAATQVVTPSNPQGWYIQSGTGGTVQYVAATGAMGSGAVQFTTNTDPDYTRFKNDINVPLSSINSLSYMTHQVSAPTAAQNSAAVNLRLYIDDNGNGIFNDVLVYEPYYNAPVTPTGWQTWSINQSTGFWWSNSQLTYDGHTTTGAGSYATNFNLSDVLHDKPNTKVLSIGLGTGDYNSPWVVQADALQVNDTTYNFEQDKVTATSKDQCMNGGWQNVADSNGKSFKNQGDCVSFIATKGKNQASIH